MTETKGTAIANTRRYKIKTFYYVCIFSIILNFYIFFDVLNPSSLFQKSSSSQVEVSSPPVFATSQEWPYTPFYTRDTEIFNTLDLPITLVGINWPGHGLPMVPEGLQHQSIKAIVAKVKDLGMNVVRLTYATELVDDIYNGDMIDVGLKESFVKALGEKNGTRVYERVVDLNPDLRREGVTRLDVFDAVAKELARQKIYVHLDNHISKAGWCCGLGDGNGWFEDTYFHTANWVRGLKYMTNHASTKWPSFISTSLRNEPRDTPSNPAIHATYNWTTWHKYMIPALHAVHETNPNPLIFVSGMGYDTTLEPVINGDDLGDGIHIDFTSLDTNLRRKIVWELHNYNNSVTSCDALTSLLNRAGYDILTTPNTPTVSKPKNIAPVMLTEFGFPQTPDHTGSKSVYAECIASLLRSVRGGWMYWVLVGSYYEREGVQEFDEGWGILSRDWETWRSEGVVDGYFRPLVRDVLAGSDGDGEEVDG